VSKSTASRYLVTGAYGCIGAWTAHLLVARGSDVVTFDAGEGARVLAARPPRPDLAPDPALPDDTRLWAALQQTGGGAWGGCVYDVDAIIRRLTG